MSDCLNKDHHQKSWGDPKDSGGQGSKDSSEMLRNFRIQGVEDSAAFAEATSCQEGSREMLKKFRIFYNEPGEEP